MGTSSINWNYLGIIFQVILRRWICIGFLIFSTHLFALDVSSSETLLAQTSLVFSGIVDSEKGEQYAYFLQMQRQGDQLKSTAALFDVQTKQVILQEESSGLYDARLPYHWYTQYAFLNFNPITASWVFGFKTKEKKGFNFKIDRLTQTDEPMFEELLRPGLKVFLNQANALNGHVHLQRDEFVTARHAWFRQITADLESSDHMTHLVKGLLCQFNNESGFYSIQLPENDALQAAVAGRFDKEGQLYSVSQFIQVEQKTDVTEIKMSSPQSHLSMSNNVVKETLIAGFVSQAQSSGFCLLSREFLS